MALSKPQIDAVVREIAPLLSGAWVQKIFQPTPLCLIFEVRAPGETLCLLVSADPETARLHLVSERLPNPPKPPPFCQYLRARLHGARVEALEADEADRIVRLHLSTREGTFVLEAALTGKSADLLLRGEDGTVHKRLRLHAGRAGGRDAPATTRTAKHATAASPAAVERDEGQRFPVSHAIERAYHERDTLLAQRRLREAQLAELRRAIKRLGRRVDALRADLDKAGRYRGYDRYGELLKANLGRIVKGHDQVTVVDYFDSNMAELTIPLDPTKSPQGNMEDYFKKHRKYLVAEREVRPRLEEAERALTGLREKRRAIEAGEIEAEASAHSRRQPLGTRGREQARSGPFRRFTSSDGLAIYVGRNARENEELTHKFARGDDLWLHARGAPGSHVLVRMEKGASPPPDSLRDAATLALLYSDLKKSGKGEVMYTRKKWVKKAKGQAQGAVIVTQEKSLFVTLDRARLEALKARSR